jgi:predicted ATPase
MQALAPTGSIAVSAATRKLCEGFFSFKPLGPTRVKGVREPIDVFEVTGLGTWGTRLQLAAGRGLSKFVGRTQELDALRQAAEQARGGHGQVVAAMADPGLGKSRLFYEFKLAQPSGWLVLEAFSIPYRKASAYFPLIDLLRNYFKIAADDNEAVRRSTIAAAVLSLDRSLQDTIPYFFGLLGVGQIDDPDAAMDPQIKTQRTLEAIKRLLLRESLNQPVLIIFEDLHWVDEQSQALLDLLADSIGNSRVLLLVNYRPEYQHRWNNKPCYTQLRLDPFGQEKAEEMLNVLLGHSEELAIRQLIIGRTDGNPFFIEEMVQMLFEQEVLGRNGTVKLLKPISDVTVPLTVQSVLASRIDRLPSTEKELLQALAVIGKQFPISLVKQVVIKPQDELNRMLQHLQLADFIYEHAAPSEIEYTFKHALTMEVAYNSLLIGRRRILHERTGEAIEKVWAGRLDDHLTDLARHYRLSGNTRKAIHYLYLAAR